MQFSIIHLVILIRDMIIWIQNDSRYYHYLSSLLLSSQLLSSLPASRCLISCRTLFINYYIAFLFHSHFLSPPIMFISFYVTFIFLRPKLQSFSIVPYHTRFPSSQIMLTFLLFLSSPPPPRTESTVRHYRNSY